MVDKPLRILLVSTYEMGHQPLGLAAAAACLRADGHDVECLDAAVNPPEAWNLQNADMVGISVPMHTAARLGIELAGGVRRINPGAHIAFYGLYATPLFDRLTESSLADSVIGGEYEIGLSALASRLATGESESSVLARGVGRLPVFDRQSYLLPDRAGLPSLENYSHVRIDGELRLAGYVEASRGCAHTCTHCPLTPVYGGRLRLVQRETVLDDIDQLVELGARHITFGDPDWLNAVPNSLAIAEELHRRHASVTFDVTIKVEHLLSKASLLPHLADLGCIFITSAFESTDDEVLRLLEKGHTRRDLTAAIGAAAAAGIALRPTWMAFTPWTTAEGFLDILSFIETSGLVNNVQPVQYALSLLLPPGSPLVEVIDRQGLLQPFDEKGLTFGWNNPDPRLEPLRREIAQIVEADATPGLDGEAVSYEATFAKVKRAAQTALSGIDEPVTVAAQPLEAVPGLTEAWFC